MRRRRGARRRDDRSGGVRWRRRLGRDRALDVDRASSVRPLVDEIGPAIAAVEAELGGPQQYFEVNATPQVVNVFVATDGATAVTPYVYVGGELAPAGAAEPAEGATFAADALTFDPATVLDGLTAELPGSDVVLFTVLGGPGGAVQYTRRRAVERGWDARRDARRRRHRAGRRPRQLNLDGNACHGALTPPWYGGPGMTTWGPSKKQTAKSRRPASSSRPAGTRGRAAGPARSGSDDTTQVAPATRPRGAVSSATPPSGGSRREQTTDELRRAVGGREHEFLGHRPHRRRRADRPGALPRPRRSARAWARAAVRLGRRDRPLSRSPSSSSSPASRSCARGSPRTRPGSSSAGASWASPSSPSPTSSTVRSEVGDLDAVYRSGGLLGAVAGTPLRGAALTRRGGRHRPRRRHRRRTARHPDLAAHDGDAHRPGRRQRRPADGARRPPGAARPVVAEQRPRGSRRRGHRRHDRAGRAAPAAAADRVRRGRRLRRATAAAHAQAPPGRRGSGRRRCRRATAPPSGRGRCRRARTSRAPARRPSTGPRSRRAARSSRSPSRRTASTPPSSA